MTGNGYATASRRYMLDFLKQSSERSVTAAEISNY